MSSPKTNPKTSVKKKSGEEEGRKGRPSWEDYFLDIAQVVASRSTCYRRKVGAVIVRDKQIISTGYNGAPKYQPNCQDLGFCYRDKNNIKSLTEIEKCRAIGSHAESNAICLAAKCGSATDNTIMYIQGHTDICAQCRGMIANSGITQAIIRKDNGTIERHDVTKWIIHPVDQDKSQN